MSKAEEFEKMLEGEDQKEESLHDLFGKKSDDETGDGGDEEEEEKQVQEEGQAQAVKFNLADLDDVSETPARDPLEFLPGGNRPVVVAKKKRRNRPGPYSSIFSTVLERKSCSDSNDHPVLPPPSHNLVAF